MQEAQGCERMNDERIVALLTELRDNQRETLERQRAHLAIAQSHLELWKAQIAESLKLQREAVSRTRTVVTVALPALLFCIAAIVYLWWRYL